ncbi:GDP-mannose 4,6-dehydratase [Pseudoxanthomonas sp. F37]|uniref:GDP-mannose 4,6-dehydratase n=1 Tax=Pseudoxanthomonas TaxID=83618 RepID=UPI001FD05D28|nr:MULTISPECIES: GDP-mannose 4,6-dehydratase [Pseudoxanthomonas]UOV06583.1 GDP-mannose 4,6-dehydratase [Pseudoxanthomonas mexicana]UOV08190.1 GDP-mannose 4,6-dehydratase [Pseudoxanthomonas sp. F37]
MAEPGKRVLVTGALGFTGRYLMDELSRSGYQVVGMGSGESDRADYHRVDLTDAEAMRSLLADLQPRIVIHLAALAFVGHGDADDFYRVNVIGTRHLLDAAAGAGNRPDCVLLASSANVYGNASEGSLSESTPPAPANDYAVSKLAMEYMARLWSDRLPIVVARPFNYTGVGQASNYLLPKIVAHFRRRAERIELGNLDVSRDFSDVRTVVHLYRRLVETRDAVGGTYNISSGQAHSLREVVAMCSELTGHDLEIEVNPAFVRANEVKVLRGDNASLRALLGDWQAAPLRETLRWMLADG